MLFRNKSHRVIYPAVGSVLKQFQPDIFYVNSEPEGFLAWHALVLRNRKSPASRLVIDSWRNVDHRAVGFPYKLGALHRAIEEKVLGKADHCVVHSVTARELYGRMSFARVTVIPPAVDTRLFAPTPNNGGRRRDAGEFVIGYVGRFVPEKGGDILLRACALLNVPYRLMMVGEGRSLGAWAELAADLDIQRHAEWLPPVPHSRVPELLARMDVLVLPSISTRFWCEQFGRILIEAMACGVPVIGSSSGEIPDVIGETGWLFDEGNAEELAQVLTEIRTDAHLREEVVEKALQKVRTLYSAGRIAGEYATLFQSLVSTS
jgi:glycosyltransferase involved in cell wall biosynthesis